MKNFWVMDDTKRDRIGRPLAWGRGQQT